MDERQKILKRVNRVFSTHPRISQLNDTVWIERKEIEDQFSDLLAIGDRHICIDGPSGSGKTSLARSGLTNESVSYAYAQVTRDTDFPSLCRQIIGPEQKRGKGLKKHEYKIGIKGFVPFGEMKSEFGSDDGDPTRNRSFTASWDVQDLAYLLWESKIRLVIDDVEKASLSLINKIADLLKYCTSQYRQQIIFIGTGDIFKRVYDSDPSLSGRMEQISVASIENRLQAWELLYRGFQLIGMHSPQTLARSIRRANVNAELDAAAEAIYAAADGLPKLLNELGAVICEDAMGARNLSKPRMKISKADIVKSCARVIERNAHLIRRKFPDFVHLMENDAQTSILLKLIYKNGVNRVHYWSDLCEDAIEYMSNIDFEYAMSRLMESGLFIRTGFDQEVIFSEDPLLTHVFGVVSRDPKKYRMEGYFSETPQFSLPLLPERDD